MTRVLKTMKQLAQQALDVQSASNFRAVVSTFGNAMTDLNHHLNKHPTLEGIINSSAADDIAMRAHPITVLWVSKLHSMCPAVEQIAEFEKSYDWCQRKSTEPDPPPPPPPEPMTFVVFRKSTNTNAWCQYCYWLFNKQGNVITVTCGDHVAKWGVKDKVQVPTKIEQGLILPNWVAFLTNAERVIQQKTEIPEDVYPAMVSEFGDPNE